MADFITLTPQPIVVTSISGNSGKQPLFDAVDVSAYDVLSLQLFVPVAVTGNVTIKVMTSMQNQSEDGWVTAITFQQLTTGGTSYPAGDLNTTDNFLKYVRWEVTELATGQVTFFIRGMARRYA